MLVLFQEPGTSGAPRIEATLAKIVVHLQVIATFTWGVDIGAGGKVRKMEVKLGLAVVMDFTGAVQTEQRQRRPDADLDRFLFGIQAEGHGCRTLTLQALYPIHRPPNCPDSFWGLCIRCIHTVCTIPIPRAIFNLRDTDHC